MRAYHGQFVLDGELPPKDAQALDEAEMFRWKPQTRPTRNQNAIELVNAGEPHFRP